jgi:hypothetical protein
LVVGTLVVGTAALVVPKGSKLLVALVGFAAAAAGCVGAASAMLRRSIPKELLVAELGVGTAAAEAATEDLFCSCSEGGAEAFAALVVEAAALVELLVWEVAAVADSEYHFLSMYFILMNSFSFTGSLLRLGINSLSKLYFAKYFALKAVLPTLASMATSMSVNTLMDRPLTLNWKSRLTDRQTDSEESEDNDDTGH